MEGQEILALEIGKARAEKMHREAARDHLAASFGKSTLGGSRLVHAWPIVVGIVAALAWLAGR